MRQLTFDSDIVIEYLDIKEIGYPSILKNLKNQYLFVVEIQRN